MKVYFDAEAFLLQRYGGISSYFSNVIAEFVADESHGVDLVGLPRYAKAEALVATGVSRRPPVALLARRRALELLNLPFRGGARHHASVVHSTYYSRSTVRRRAGQVVATTVHDMTPELYPQYFARNPHLNKVDQVRQADVVFCVSETTRQDLAQLVPGVTGKVVVTSAATAPPFTDPTPPSSPYPGLDVPFPYVLFVGSRAPYKAFGLLVRALGLVRCRGLDLGLVVVGGPLSPSERESLRAHDVPSSRVWTRQPDDLGLAHLYRSALLLSYPSEYEGFGIPVLDALASGCPVVASDAPALREVGGDRVLVHPRGDADALADRLRTVVEMPGRDLDALRRRGREHALTFRWSDVASRVADGYRGA